MTAGSCEILTLKVHSRKRTARTSTWWGGGGGGVRLEMPPSLVGHCLRPMGVHKTSQIRVRKRTWFAEGWGVPARRACSSTGRLAATAPSAACATPSATLPSVTMRCRVCSLTPVGSLEWCRAAPPSLRHPARRHVSQREHQKMKAICVTARPAGMPPQ